MSDANTTAQAAVPAWPFVCEPTSELPAGWVRGDPARADPERLPIAYDPRRHTVVSLLRPGAGERLAAAGFAPLDAGADPASALVFVRQRATEAQARRRPTPRQESGRSL